MFKLHSLVSSDDKLLAECLASAAFGNGISTNFYNLAHNIYFLHF